MKKKNLATAMAAAMMFGGVAPVVAHADNKVEAATDNGKLTNEEINNMDGKTYTVDVDKANAQTVKVMTYDKVYKNNGTLETKDDELALKEGQEIVYAKGTIGKTLDGTDAQYVIATKMSDDDMKKQEDAIKTAKANYEGYKANLEQLQTLTFTENGKTEKVYTINKEESKKNTGFLTNDKNEKVGSKQTIVLTNNNSDVNKYPKQITFVFNNVKMDSELVNKNDEVEGLIKFSESLKDSKFVQDFNLKGDISTIDVSNREGVSKLNKLAYELSHTYNSDNTETKSSEDYVDGKINKTITVTEKGTKNEVGQIVLVGYDKFKADKFEGFVNISEIKDLTSLDQSDLSWAKPAVMDALYNGQLKGYEDNTLRLNGNVTRAEFARMLVQLRGTAVKEADLKENFSDVKPSDWFYKDVATLATLGIVKGDGNGTFRPDDTITRQEAAVMIAKAINNGADVDRFNEKTGKAIDTDTIFTDDEAIAIWADGAVNALNKEGVINGYNEGKNKLSFKPENKITRAESIVMLNNSKACESVAKYIEQQ